MAQTHIWRILSASERHKRTIKISMLFWRIFFHIYASNQNKWIGSRPPFAKKYIKYIYAKNCKHSRALKINFNFHRSTSLYAVFCVCHSPAQADIDFMQISCQLFNGWNGIGWRLSYRFKGLAGKSRCKPIYRLFNVRWFLLWHLYLFFFFYDDRKFIGRIISRFLNFHFHTENISHPPQNWIPPVLVFFFVVVVVLIKLHRLFVLHSFGFSSPQIWSDLKMIDAGR